MQNMKVKIFSVAMAAITAASPILSSYTAYASDIMVNDDGTVTQISTSTDNSNREAEETKFLFINLSTTGGKVVLNDGEEQEETIRLNKEKDEKTYIQVYDKNGVLISTENAIDNGYTYVYEAKVDDAVNVKAVADDGYEVKQYILSDDSSGTEMEEDTGFESRVGEFKYLVFMEYDKTVKIEFEKKEDASDIEEDLSVSDVADDTENGESSDDTADAEASEDTKDDADLTIGEDSDDEAGGDETADEDGETEDGKTEDDLLIGNDNITEANGQNEVDVTKPTESADSERDFYEPEDAEADDDITYEVSVSDNEDDSKTDEDNVEEAIETAVINTDSNDSEHFSEIANEISLLDSEMFTSARLVVMTDDNAGIIDTEHIIANYDNIYLMQYSTVEQAMTAYLYYSQNVVTGDIEAVEPDMPMDAADEESGTAPVEETSIQMSEDTNPISSIEEAKASEAKEYSNVIALIDTGVSESDNVIDRVSLIGDELEGNGHGDKMMQAITGQNKNANVLSIRTMGDDGRGTVSSIIAGMEYALNQNVSIINLSLSAKTNLANSVLRAEIEKAVDAGVTVVAAAGNDNADVKDYMPGSVEAATVIGAADEKGERLLGSNYGDTVDYNVVANTTSEAAAKFSGFLTTGEDVMNVINIGGVIFQPDYQYIEPDITEAPEEPSVRDDKDGIPENEPEENPWVIDGYPESNTTEYEDENIYVRDITYNFSSYNPYGDDVTMVCNDLNTVAEFTKDATAEFTYTCRLNNNPDYKWTLDVIFTMVNDKQMATVKSKDFDKIFPSIVNQDRNKGYGGIVPEHVGDIVEGRSFDVLADTEDFDVEGLIQDYNPLTFKVNSVNENGFDIHTPGIYKVTYEMSYFMYFEYTWFVTDTINVVDTKSLQPGVYLTSKESTLLFKSDDDVNRGYGEFVKVNPNTNYILSSVSDEYTAGVVSSDENINPDDYCTITDIDSSLKSLKIATPEVNNVVVFSLERPGYSALKVFAGGGWKPPTLSEGQLAELKDFESYEKELLKMSSEDIDEYMTVAASGFKTVAHTTTTCRATTGTDWNGEGTSWAMAHLYEKRQTIYNWVKKQGYDMDISDIVDIDISCISGYDYKSWPPNIDVTCQLDIYVQTNDEKKTSRVRVVVTANRGAAYQVFKNSAYYSSNPEIGWIVIRKRMADAELADFTNLIGDLYTTFTVYTDSACTEVYKVLRINAKEVDPADGYISYKVREKAEADKYWVKETYTIGGTVYNEEKYGPITVTKGKETDVGSVLKDNTKYSNIGKTGWIYNKPFYFNGDILIKEGDDGKKLKGAVFRVQYSEKNFNSFTAKRTWYLQTDENGKLKFDNDHYLASWTDSKGSVHKSGALLKRTTGIYALPVGYLRVKEMQAPSGYKTNGDTFDIQLKSTSVTNIHLATYINGKADTLKVVDPSSGGFKLGKFLYDADKFAMKTPRVVIDTEFTIFKNYNAASKTCSDVVKVVTVKADSKDDKSLTVLVDSLEPGKYYLQETKRCPGTTENSNIYSFVIKDGQDTPTEEIENVVTNKTGTKVGNTPFRFTGLVLEKVDEKGNKLKLPGAIFKIVYSPYKKGETGYKEMYTWYYHTDTNGEVKIDKDHYESSYNGIKSDEPLQLDDGTYAIPSGTLYVTEVKAPEGYDVDGKTHELLLKGQKDTDGKYTIKELVATPLKIVEPTAGKKWKVQVKLKKVDENGNGLAGAKFFIWDNEKCEGDPIGKLESGEGGESNILKFDDISWDKESYILYCMESEPPIGYTSIDDKFSVTFKRSDFEKLYEKDGNTKGELKYFGPETGIPNEKGWTVRVNARKVDTNKDGLEGAEFTVYKFEKSEIVTTPDGDKSNAKLKEVGKLISGKDGMTNELSIGLSNREKSVTLICEETQAPEGFVATKEKFELTFEKSVYDELYKADTNTKGELKTFGPENGIENPTGTPTPSIPVTQPPTPTPPSGSGLHVKKISKASDDIMDLNSYTLAGAEFEVTSSRDGYMGILTTDENGFSNVLSLPDNSIPRHEDAVVDEKDGHIITPARDWKDPVTTTYYITEKTPPHWHKKNYSTKSITVVMPRDANATFEVPFDDEPEFCDDKGNSFDIEKLGVKGEAIEGVVFKVEYFDGEDDNDNPVRTWYLKTNKDGHAKLNEAFLDPDNNSDRFFIHNGEVVIPIGGYLKVTEIKAPAEYVLDDTPVGVKTEKGADFKFTYANNNAWYNELQRCRVDLQKYETDGVTPIAGVEFEIKFLEAAITPTTKKHPNFKRLLDVGETLVRHTDENGQVYFDNLDQGTYQITEIKTEPGKALLKEPIIFTLPFTMTRDEAIQYGNVDFTNAKEDIGYTNKWFFYNCKYEITNNAVFKMPVTGDDGKWKYGFVGFGIMMTLGAGWFIYDMKLKKARKRKRKI